MACTWHTKHHSRRNMHRHTAAQRNNSRCSKRLPLFTSWRSFWHRRLENDTRSMPPSKVRQGQADDKKKILLNMKVMQWQDKSDKRAVFHSSRWRMPRMIWACTVAYERIPYETRKNLPGCRTEVEVKIMKLAFSTSSLRKGGQRFSAGKLKRTMN